MSQQEEDQSRYTRTLVVKPALSQMYDQLLPTSKSLETACKNQCTHTSAPRHVRVPWSRNFSDCWSIGDGSFCAKLCVETLCKRATSVAHLTNFSFEFFMKFSQKVPLYVFFYTMVQKSQKWPKTQSRSPALRLKENYTFQAVFIRAHTQRHPQRRTHHHTYNVYIRIKFVKVSLRRVCKLLLLRYLTERNTSSKDCLFPR